MRSASLVVTLFAAGWATLGASSALAAGPTPRREAKACFAGADRSAGKRVRPILWLASNPHLPLARTDRRGLTSPTEAEACKRPGLWGTKGRPYHVLDRWGQPEARARVAKRERYEVSGCDEIVMTGPQAAMGDRLLVADDGAWSAAPSFEAKPSVKERAGFEAFVKGLDERTSPAQGRLGAGPRTSYFRVGAPGCRPAEDSAEAALVGLYALAVGPYAVLARHDGTGWRAVWWSEPPRAGNAYEEHQLLAILDMDGDDVPEVVLHQSDETDFWDVVIGHGDDGRWRERVRSAAGSTI